jgi:phosphoglycerate kinase
MIKSINELDVAGKKVLVRCDFNVPMVGDIIEDDTRIIKSLPTIVYLLKNHAKVILMSHLGRPAEGVYDEAFSLQPIANRLSQLLQESVFLAKDLSQCQDVSYADHRVILLENVRFNVGEESNDEVLAKKYADLADVFVMDAFGSAHRCQASTVGVAQFFEQKGIGCLMAEELHYLQPLIHHPKKPVLAIIGGSKISTKLDLLFALLDKVDRLIIGGGMANTFLQAIGVSIGASLTENDLIVTAKNIIEKAKVTGVRIGLPVDVVVVKMFKPSAPFLVKSIEAIETDDIIIDVGPKTRQAYDALIDTAQTIIWNGPVGVVEWPSGENGTKALGEKIVSTQAFCVAGGGDTIAFINKHHWANKLSYISTGGGAFLAYLEGQTLPAMAALQPSIKKEAL